MTENNSNLARKSLETIAGDIKYKPLLEHEDIRKESRGYNRDDFLDRQGDLGDISEYFSALNNPQTRNDPETIRELSQVVFGDPSYLEGASAEVVNDVAKMAHRAGSRDMSYFVSRNYETMVDKIDNKSLLNIIRSLPPRRSGDGNSSHNELAELVKETQEMTSIAQSQERSPEKMQQYLLVQLQKAYEAKAISQELFEVKMALLRTPGMVEQMFSGNYSRKQKLLENSMKDEGEFNRNRLNDYLTTNIRIAKNRMVDEEKEGRSPKDLDKMWERDLMPYYLNIAKAAEGFEKKARDDENPDKSEQKQRDKESAERNWLSPI